MQAAHDGGGRSRDGIRPPRSATVYRVSRAKDAEGDVAKIKIGAFRGAGVTYRRVAGKSR